MSDFFDGDLRNKNIIQGFAAAYRGDDKSLNPYNKHNNQDDYDAWDHGRECFFAKIIPLALEEKLDKKTEAEIDKIKIEFEKSGILPLELESFLDQ
ncbi:MAG: hypothetical protein Q8Q37_02325 [bacterium]|nr:hypothetical protein [bacterium]